MLEPKDADPGNFDKWRGRMEAQFRNSGAFLLLRDAKVEFLKPSEMEPLVGQPAAYTAWKAGENKVAFGVEVPGMWEAKVVKQRGTWAHLDEIWVANLNATLGDDDLALTVGLTLRAAWTAILDSRDGADT